MPSIYDLINEKTASFEAVIKELESQGLEIVSRNGHQWRARPLCHESSSGNALSINVRTGQWLCYACSGHGVRGDIVQLVEYVKGGGAVPMRGSGVSRTPQRREALDFLSDSLAIPRQKLRAALSEKEAALEFFVEDAHEYLMRHAPEIVEEIGELWGFDADVIKSARIGYVPGGLTPGVRAALEDAEFRRHFVDANLVYRSRDGGDWVSNFAGRIVFPYLSGGRAVYLIGRRTKGLEHPAKYVKLSVAGGVRNPIFGEDTVHSRARRVYIAEGIADATWILASGLPVISPVTVNVPDGEMDRLVSLLNSREVEEVAVVLDNEPSGVGSVGARKLASRLADGGLAVRVVELPLEESHLVARAELERLGADADPAWVRENQEAGKLDVAQWAASQGGLDEVRSGLEALADAAPEWTEAEIAMALEELQALEGRELRARFEPICEMAARSDDITFLAEVVERLHEAFPSVTKASIRARINKLAKDRASALKEQEREQEELSRREMAKSSMASLETWMPPALSQAPPPPRPGAPPPEAVSEAEAMEVERERFQGLLLNALEGEATAAQLSRQVHRFLRQALHWRVFSAGSSPLILSDGEVVAKVGSTAFREAVTSVLGAIPAQTSRAITADVARRFEAEVGGPVRICWAQNLEAGLAIHLGEDAFRLADGRVELMSVADRRDLPFRRPATHRFLPIEPPLDEVRPGGGAAIQTFMATLPIADSTHPLVASWILALPLIHRAGDCPILRIEGAAGSGKSYAAEAITTAIAGGGDLTELPTDAAQVDNWASSVVSIDDNREVDDMGRRTRNLYLVAASLQRTSKRSTGKDVGVEVDFANSALISTGIEPLASLTELSRRMLTVTADRRLRRATRLPSDREGLRVVRQRLWSEMLWASAWAVEAYDSGRYAPQVREAVELLSSSNLSANEAYWAHSFLVWLWTLDDREREVALEDVPNCAWARSAGYLDDSATLALAGSNEIVAAVAEALRMIGRGQVPPPTTETFVEEVDGRRRVTMELKTRRLRSLLAELAGEFRAFDFDTQGMRVGRLQRRLPELQQAFEAIGISMRPRTGSAGRRKVTPPEGFIFQMWLD
jgi:hypothetical protein